MPANTKNNNFLDQISFDEQKLLADTNLELPKIVKEHQDLNPQVMQNIEDMLYSNAVMKKLEEIEITASTQELKNIQKLIKKDPHCLLRDLGLIDGSKQFIKIMALLEYFGEEIDPAINLKQKINQAHEYSKALVEHFKNRIKFHEVLIEDINHPCYEPARILIEFYRQELLLKELKPRLHSEEFEESVNLIADTFERHKSPQKKVEAARTALEICQYCIPAYHILIEEVCQTAHETIALAEYAIAKANKFFGDEFFEVLDGSALDHPMTHPYLALRINYIHALIYLEEYPKAIDIIVEHLDLDEQDHSGLRYELITLFLLEERYQEARMLLLRFNSSDDPSWVYDTALLELLDKGDSTHARKLIANAVKLSPEIKDLILKKQETPMTPNSQKHDDEYILAIDYYNRSARLWGSIDNLENIFAS